MNAGFVPETGKVEKEKQTLGHTIRGLKLPKGDRIDGHTTHRWHGLLLRNIEAVHTAVHWVSVAAGTR